MSSRLDFSYTNAVGCVFEGSSEYHECGETEKEEKLCDFSTWRGLFIGSAAMGTSQQRD